MKQQNLNRKYHLSKFILCCVLIVTFQACKKADKFYDTLGKLPQIENNAKYAYKTAYIIGDTMIITGRLQPQNNLKITIGGVTAPITKTGTVFYDTHDSTTIMDQIGLLITPEMEGKSREVKVTSGGYNVTGAAIDVYSEGGKGSFTNSLKAMTVKNFSDSQQLFLFCLNGKGDTYYYSLTTRDIRHIKKDGTEEVVYDLSNGLDPSGNVLVSAFLTGGVDPLGQYLYFSVQTNIGYSLLQLNLQNKTLSTLNSSSDLSAPYEGNINNVHVIVTGIYPDAKGNLYLSLGLGNNALLPNSREPFIPDAIARYNKASGKLTYVYKQIYKFGTTTYADMPGTSFVSGGPGNSHLTELRFSPEESLFYALETNAITNTFQIFDLTAPLLLQTFSTDLSGASSVFDVIAPFSGLKLGLGEAQPDRSFGYLPLPGKRLQTLLYQSTSGFNGAGKNSFPKWVVFDFTDQRTYAYAPGKFDQGKYVFQPTFYLSPKSTVIDAMLNYDEQGNLYSTANGKMTLIKTQTVN
jgi:hypothetical protein